MGRYLVSCLALVGAGALTSACRSESARVVQIDQVKAHLNPDGPGAVVFLRLSNPTQKIRGVTGARAESPRSASILTWAYEGERPVTRPAETLWIPPGRNLVLRGGGVHVRVVSTEGPPTIGTPLVFELGFDDDSWQRVEARISPLGKSPAGLGR